ncbi:hypothetical protein A2U01_0049930, partial [Trifolium medium]|nr:hypothetical protein [Trifolium medium]
MQFRTQSLELTVMKMHARCDEIVDKDSLYWASVINANALVNMSHSLIKLVKKSHI